MTSLRVAFRSLTKAPGFTLIALLTLALGVGANTSMFTLLDVLLFRSAPFPEPDRLVMIQGTTAQTQRDGFSFAEAEEIRTQAGPRTGLESTTDGDHAFESITTWSGWSNTFADPGQPAERLTAIDATADFFQTFRVQPILGRAYTAEEQVPGKNQVAVLSHQLWQSRFGGDPDVIGRAIRLNAEQVTVIGVMPPSFAYPFLWGKVDLWRPITIPSHIVEDRNNHFFGVTGRLKPGVTPTQAQAQLTPLAARWAQDYPQTSTGRDFNVRVLHKAAMDDTSVFLSWFLFGLGAVVLLIACFNIANLQLARATANVRDLAIRTALGASRSRLIVHQLTESMVLAIAGGACGLLVAAWTNAALSRAIRIGEAGNLPLPMDGRILIGALGMSVLAGAVFGLLPAWFASRGDVVGMLKQQARGSTSGRGPRLMRHALIVAEVALALAMLGTAGVMIRGLESLLTQDKGWDTERVLAANIHLPEQSTYQTEEKRRIAIDQLVQRIARIPGAEHTSICTEPPLFGYSKSTTIHVESKTSDDPTKLPLAGFTMIAADYFATIGISLREGRQFSPDLKADGPPEVIINETMARQFWPGESALGKRIAEHHDNELVWREVVGVVSDIQFALNIGNPNTMLQVYKPLVQEPWGYMWLMVRGPAPAGFKQDIRRAVTDIDPDVAVQQMFTIPEAAARFNHNLVVVNQTLAGFALLGLVLAAVGLYGVISHLVAQRTTEFGVRLALGAKPGDVLWLVLRTGVVLTVIGLAIGSVVGLLLNWALHRAMPRMAPIDPATLAAVAVVLFFVALFACWWPARRATKVDPLTALRAD